METFVTAKSRLEQTDVPGYWKTIDNELYYDKDCNLILVPRYFWTDGYTFPKMVMAILGDKNRYDVRPAHQHDLFCRFHEEIVVNCSLTVLKSEGYLREHNGKTICEDIPEKYLEIRPITKWDADCTFKRMMKACNIEDFIANVIRFGVFFNLRWIQTGKKSLKEYSLFNEDIGLVNGL